MCVYINQDIISTSYFRDEFVAKQMEKMPQLIEEFRKRLHKVEEKEAERKAKVQELVEEARDFYGYDVDPRDPRFQEMVEKKEEEARMAKKKQQKEQRKALNVAAMLQLQEQARKEKEAATKKEAAES